MAVTPAPSFTFEYIEVRGVTNNGKLKDRKV